MRSRRWSAAVVAAVVPVLAVSGCSGSTDKKPAEGESVLTTFPTTIPSQPPYLDVPDGVHLTPPGRGLSLGLSATVAWVPRQDEVGVVRLSVEQIETSTVGELLSDFTLDERQSNSTPYLVRAKVTNVGERSLGGRPLPLYLATTDGTLVTATTVDDQFKPCWPNALPGEFAQGDKAEICLLFLLSNDLEPLSVSFVPTVEVDPIYWQGTVTKYGATPKPGKGGKSDKGDKKGHKKGDKKGGKGNKGSKGNKGDSTP